MFRTFTCNTIDEQENIIHIIERQMKKDWQIEFEDKNVLSLPEEYVLHVFVKKITGLGKILDRCIVLSTNVRKWFIYIYIYIVCDITWI